MVYTGFSLSFIPLFRWLSERIGKNRCLAIATSIVLMAALSTWWTFNPEQPWLMLVSTAFIGAGYAGLWLMIPSMQIDVVDYDELKTGERREGGFASIFSWVLKFGFCVGFLISGPLLEITVANAGAALYVAGLAEDLPGGVLLAREAITNGSTRKTLDALRRFGR